ncbi:MAG: GldG family protein [Burkholderiales bacterium]
MQVTRKLRTRMAVQHGLFVLLALAIAILLVLVAREYRAHWDLTQSLRNSLSQGSRDLLRELAGPITITAFATAEDPRLGDVRKLIADFFAPYQRAKADLTLAFVDPKEQPKRARDAGISSNGEMLVEYQARSERLSQLSEQSVADLLSRLARKQERMVMYLTGHGEPSLEGAANHDLGEFGKQLGAKGFKIASLNLAVAPEVPANVSLLIITHPQIPLIKGETEKLMRYLEKGGSLLWLLEPGVVRSLEPVAEQLGITLSTGTVIDPAGQQLNLPATWALATEYAQHPIFREFDLITVFPLARKIVASAKNGWQAQTLIEVAKSGWIETAPVEKEVSFDEKQDARGPVSIAVALSKPGTEKEQRIVVVGSQAFLANAYLGNAGNRDLGLNIANWLAGDEGLITVQPKNRRDSTLELSQPRLFAITATFLLALPLAFLSVAGWIWWKRRNA